ncbi:MAG TPA: hypothetical protein VHT04_14110 [Stellaceae bacterium]|nr:hypothetical protein [Stellaceae bacterium]
MTRADMRGAVLSCGIVLALAACQSGPKDWTKPGAGPADLQRDMQDCRAQAVAMSPLVFDTRSQQQQVDEVDILLRQTTCMMINGWQLTPRK